MTDVQELLDLEQLFDSVRPCESLGKPCEQPALWLVVPNDREFLRLNGELVRDQALCDMHKNSLVRKHMRAYGRLRIRIIPLPKS